MRRHPISAQQSNWENDRRAWAPCWVNVVVAGLLGLGRVAALIELDEEWKLMDDGWLLYEKSVELQYLSDYRFPILER